MCKYELGVMDLYPIVANRTMIENNPFFQVKLKEKVDGDRLYRALMLSLEEYPLFACTIRYDKRYYLETIHREVKLINAKESERPLEFGDATNGYLWQMSYYDNSVIFEWCHTVSDGRGAFAFFCSVIAGYFGVRLPVKPAFGGGLESFYDKSEKGIPQKKQEKGFSASALPYIKRGYKTDCHILKTEMSRVLTVAKKNDSSPAAVLPPLFSMALRKHMGRRVKNKNVSCNVVIDCRVPMKTESMHNSILLKNITYVDRFDSMDFSKVSTIYRGILDLAVQRENIIAGATETVDDLNSTLALRPRFLQSAAMKLRARFMKHSDSNFTFTYLGKVTLPEQVTQEIVDMNFRSWTDFGECNIAAIDFKGTLILNICENYKDKEIVPDFIDICKQVGINLYESELLEYEQANMRMKKIGKI